MEADQLIRQMKQELEIPGEPAGDTHTPLAYRETAEWRELERAVRALREAADAVGVKPTGYPLPVDLVMRAMQALLPWYTRPLRHQAEQCVALATAVEALLHRIAARQEALEIRLRQTEEGGGDSA